MKHDELLEKLYLLFEQNVNEPKRKSTLNAISNHSEASLLAELVFARMAPNAFLSAKNQLLPKEEGDKDGPFDHLLEAQQCHWILKLISKEDYVYNLLKDVFQVKNQREPNRLSDIVKIVADRKEIKTSPCAKAVFKTWWRAKIGSDWIVTTQVINGDEFHMGGNLFLYKILRSKHAIHLENIQLKYSYSMFTPFFFREPFLIMIDKQKNSFDVFNLLEPKEQPMIIRKEGEVMGNIAIDHFGENYDSDVRVNGRFLESIIFPFVYKKDETSVCIEFAEIGRTSIKILSKETITLPLQYNRHELTFLDHDNLILQITPQNGCVVFHIILSKQKVIAHYLPELFTQYMHFGMVQQHLGIMIDIELPPEEEDGPDVNYFAFGLLLEKDQGTDLEIICFFKLGWTQIINIHRNMLVFWYENCEDTHEAIAVGRLLNHLETKGHEMPSFTEEVNGVEVTAPLIKCENLLAQETMKDMVTKENVFKDRSSIGRTRGSVKQTIEIFI